MPKAGIQSACSTNWNSADPRSKPNQRISDSRKVRSEVQSASQRALRATAAGSPRSSRIRTLPTIGKKVTMERIGQLLMMRSASPPEEIPADDQHHADQHDEGVVVDIAGLQPPGPLGEDTGDRRDPVRAQPVD